MLGLYLFLISPLMWDLVQPPEDKAIHFFAYLFFTLLLDWCTNIPVRAVLCLSLVVATGDELSQRFVPGRTPGLDDWFTDVWGILLAGLILWGWHSWRAHLEYKSSRRRRIIGIVPR